VDRIKEAGAKHGGKVDINPKQDLGFMYNRNLADPHGHVWEAMWMDPTATPASH
jgi:predicted lactoylglutathione lyase